ncbi:MAG: hypothetical protein ACI9A1_001611 [Lentimonas sp.]|jgi:hypothetical protein
MTVRHMKYPTILCALSTLLLPISMAAQQPLVTVNLQSYRAVLDDAARIAAAVAPDQPVQLEAIIQSMVGAEAIALIDPNKPWHLALWMDQLGQQPSAALYLPASDAEAFEAAIATGFLATQALTVTDSGDFIILTQSQTTDATLGQRAADYGQQLPAEVADTLSVQLKMNEPVRAMALGGLQLSKGMMLSSMQTAITPEMGLPAGCYESIFGAYFGVFEYVLRDLSTLNLSLSVDDEDLNYSFSIEPTAESELAAWMRRQNIEITDIMSSTNWDDTMAVAVSMAPLTAGERATWSDLAETMMPLYGLQAKDAEQWMQLIDATLPLKAGYSVELAESFSFEGFYQLLNGSADEVYVQTMKLIELMPTAEKTPASYYSAIEFQPGIREVNGHSVDRITMTMNLEHPTMQMPGQKEQILALFQDGQIAYESAVIDDRIYCATSGRLEQALKKSYPKPAIQPSAATRMLASFNIISLMKIGAQSAPEIAPVMSALDENSGSIWCLLNVSDSLEMQTIVPLQVLTEFSKMEQPALANPSAPSQQDASTTAP